MNVDDLAEERRRLYADYRKDLLARQLSNSENFDRSILSLSSAIIAVSVAFIRGQGLSSALRFSDLLWISWVAFGLAILFTLISFQTSQWAIEQHLEFAAQYYLQGHEDALTKSSVFRTVTSCLNALSGLAFAAGIALTVVFAIGNLR